MTIFAPEGTGGAIAASYNLFQISTQPPLYEAREDIGYFRCKARTNRDRAARRKVVLDGEMIGETPIEIVCIPKGLTLIAPQEDCNFDPPEKLEGLPGLEIIKKEH